METAIPKNLLARLTRLNELRRSAATESEAMQLGELEAYFDQSFSAACKLAVYGSLAPGQINHAVVADIQGRWENGLAVRGELVRQGWGASLGFPALKWLADGAEVPVQLLLSTQLPQHWPRLDAFEGAEYQRVLAPVYRAETFITVANLYELRGG
jgi:gamma-glutamylcyclotransferase (GGCT)/AIG2-like uncharacterized protein YtfP